ncbi:recombinase family protein [Haloimpatiens massiliensis]|uniref:recombinase family protein n=1 Tax=Haloimpatiens massiliensis TaxID=1658110 RepID=UPI000C82B2AE|nr:recombinase family protein [Haloimpatiens massiliensis]
MRKIWNVAIYARVSTDKKEQQESIPAQVSSLKKWLLEKSKNDKEAVYNLIDVYEDAGFSGSNFQRDSFIKMKEDIEHKKINMVLTRDLSRFSRNYITAGYYLEDYFKVNGIRFISVLDNVDTLEEVNDIVPFKNILNEMYIKDCSRRSRDGLKQRMLRGSSIASKPPYGYKFQKQYNENIKTIALVPAGDETTEVVKEIYNLYLQGWGAGRIASYLNSKGIKPPSARLENFAFSKFGLWNSNTILSILKNPKYAGYMVQGRYKKISYKVKKVVKTPKEEWIIGGEFPGIISKEIFEKTQREIQKRANGYRYKYDSVHIFSGILKCNECGGSMSYRKKYKGYKCTNSQQGAKRCTAHSIKEDYLKETIISDLKNYVSKINKGEIYKKAKSKVTKKKNKNSELDTIQRELQKLDKQFEKLYLDKLEDVINERNFKMVLENIQSKQARLLRKKEELCKAIHNEKSVDDEYKYYKDKIDRIINFQEFDRFIVESLIDKIVVTEDKNTRDKRVQVYYKFN